MLYSGDMRQVAADFEVLLTGLDPGVEFRPADGLWAADLDAVVHGRVVHGRDGYREVWQRTLDSFEDLRLEPEEVLDLGDNKLLVTVQYWVTALAAVSP